MRIAVIVPVKGFALAKERLSPSLGAVDRAWLARECASRVLAAAAPMPAYVVSDDAGVAAWATAAGATVVEQRTPGLNGAVHDGRARAIADGHDHLVIAHADIPLAASFAHVPRRGEVTLVTDRRSDGTNVLSIPAREDFVFAYGAGSRAAHLAEARRHGLVATVITDESLSLDLDTADDLAEYLSRSAANR